MKLTPDDGALNSQRKGLNLKRALQAEAELLIRSRCGCNHEDARSVQEDEGIKFTNDPRSDLVCVLTVSNQSNVSSPKKMEP